eukprot:scaffold3504_cov240-Pinguiococcus_pyrenoidosus.AAC.61
MPQSRERRDTGVVPLLRCEVSWPTSSKCWIGEYSVDRRRSPQGGSFENSFCACGCAREVSLEFKAQKEERRTLWIFSRRRMMRTGSLSRMLRPATATWETKGGADALKT